MDRTEIPQTPVHELLGLAYAAGAKALLEHCGEALGQGVSMVCRGSFGILRPARAPLTSYTRTVDGNGGTRVKICVKLVDSRGVITMNGVLEWFLVGMAGSPRR